MRHRHHTETVGPQYKHLNVIYNFLGSSWTNAMMADTLRGSPQSLQVNSGIVSLLGNAAILQDPCQFTTSQLIMRIAWTLKASFKTYIATNHLTLYGQNCF